MKQRGFFVYCRKRKSRMDVSDICIFRHKLHVVKG